jgi:hypothetical protein
MFAAMLEFILVGSVFASSSYTESEIIQRLKSLESLQLWPMGYDECLEAFGPFSIGAPHKTRHQALLLACISEAQALGITKEQFCEDLEYWKRLIMDHFQPMWDQYRRIEGHPGRQELLFRYLNTQPSRNISSHSSSRI